MTDYLEIMDNLARFLVKEEIRQSQNSGHTSTDAFTVPQQPWHIVPFLFWEFRMKGRNEGNG